MPVVNLDETMTAPQAAPKDAALQQPR